MEKSSLACIKDGSPFQSLCSIRSGSFIFQLELFTKWNAYGRATLANSPHTKGGFLCIII